MPDLLRELLGNDETVVDSIVAGGLIALLALVVFTALTLQTFGALNFATATATILGAIGGGRRLRDGGANGRDSPPGPAQ